MPNATSCTPDGDRMTVDPWRSRELWQPDMANTGCALSGSDFAGVFDRVWRADAAPGARGLNYSPGLMLVRRADRL